MYSGYHSHSHSALTRILGPDICKTQWHKHETLIALMVQAQHHTAVRLTIMRAYLPLSRNAGFWAVISSFQNLLDRDIWFPVLFSIAYIMSRQRSMMDVPCSTCGKVDQPEGKGVENTGLQTLPPPLPSLSTGILSVRVDNDDGGLLSGAPPRPFESAPAESLVDWSSGSRSQQHTDRSAVVRSLDTTMRVDLGCPPAHADRLRGPLALALRVFEADEEAEHVVAAELDCFAHSSFNDDGRETQLLLRVEGVVKGAEHRSVGDTSIPAPTVNDPRRHGVTRDEDELEQDVDVRAKRRHRLLLLLAVLASGLIVVLQAVLLWQVYGSVCAVRLFVSHISHHSPV